MNPIFENTVFYIKEVTFSESIGILIEGWYILWQCKDLCPEIFMCTGYTTLEWPPLQSHILAVPIIGLICI